MSSKETVQSPFAIAATPEIYRRNVFRLTGLPVTATARQISRQAEKLKMLAELGGEAAQQLTIIEGLEPPTKDEVREAMQRLKDAQSRAIDEFFWFWPEAWEKPEVDDACLALSHNDLDGATAIWRERRKWGNSAIASHNLAVLYHMRALEWAASDLVKPSCDEDKKNEEAMWQCAFDFWREIQDNDVFWIVLRKRIHQLGDVALTIDFAHRLRFELPQVFDLINARIAVSYAAQGRQLEAQWHVQFMASRHDDKAELTSTIDSILAPVRQKLLDAMEASENSIAQHAELGIEQASLLHKTSKPLLDVIATFLDQYNIERHHLFDKVAATMLSLAIDGYNSTLEKLKEGPPPLPFVLDPRLKAAESFIAALQLAKPLATDAHLILRIEGNIATAKSNERFATKIQPLLTRLSALRELPPQKRMGLLKGEILPAIDALLKTKQLEHDEANELCDALATVFRSLSIAAHNDEEDLRLATEAADFASRYARDADLVARIKNDLDTLRANMRHRGFTLPQRPSVDSASASRVPDKMPTSKTSRGEWAWVAGGVTSVAVIVVAVIVVAVIVLAVSSGSHSGSPGTSNTRISIPRGQSIAASNYKPSPSPYAGNAPSSYTSHTPPPSGFTNQASNKLEADINQSHAWTNSKGGQIHASLISFDGSFVLLRKVEDGVTYKYPIGQLSTESQALVRALTSQTAPALPSVALPKIPTEHTDTQLYRASNGHTYRVSHSDYVRLSQQKAALDSQESTLSAKASSLNALKTMVSNLGANLDRTRASLDNTNQYAIDRFNAQVDAYNAKLREERVALTEYNSSVNTLNAQVDAFNAELSRVGTRAY